MFATVFLVFRIYLICQNVNKPTYFQFFLDCSIPEQSFLRTIVFHHPCSTNSTSGITHTRLRGTGNSGYSGGVSGASVAPAAAVNPFNPRTHLAPVITVVAASTASNVSSVVFADYAGANNNGSGWGDFEKLLDMLFEEKLEMWKEKENDTMDEGAQEDEQFETEIDNEKTI